jgi:hypothetical protein
VTVALFNWRVPGLTPSGKVYDPAGALLHASVDFADMGDGNYQAQVSDADKAIGAIIMADGGASAVGRYQVGVVASGGLLAVLITNGDGSLYSGSGSCAFDTYAYFLDGTVIPVTPPALANPDLEIEPGSFSSQRYLWVATIPGTDVALGVSGVISTPADALPEEWPFLASEGDFAPGTGPEVTNLVPADGTLIARDQPLQFDVIDADGDLTRTHLFAYFPATKMFEVVYFSAVSGYLGAGFAPQYTGTRSVITSGFRFSGVIRRGGWPSRVVLVTDPRDATGQESV